MQDQRLMIPGPTPVPSSVLRAMSKPMINHRAKAFADILDDCTRGAQWMFQTQNDLLILSCSGTGGLEAAAVNVLSVGDRVLSLITGVFGRRWADICKAYGAEVERVEWPMGEAYDVERVREALAKGPFKVVLMTHNETSTTVLNPIAEIAALVRREQPDALLLVDSVSGLGTADLPVDKLDLDIVVAGSQKAFMLPPGLAYLSVSARAWEAIAQAKAPRFYFDLLKAREFKAKGQTPWTPAISIFYAMQEALGLLREEGLENVFARHERLARALRAGVKALGLELLVKRDAVASRAVTGVWPPEGVAANEFRKTMQSKFGIVLANGQGPVQDKIFRIGHLGYCTDLDITSCLSALEIALTGLGARLELGTSVAAAELELSESATRQPATAR